MAEDGISVLINQIKKYLEFARRMMWRWWIIGLCAAIGIGGSIAFALKATRYYKSRTLITWKPSVDKSSVSGSSGSYRPRGWLRAEVNQLTSSHTLLWETIEKFDLFPKERQFTPPEVVLDEFYGNLDFGTVGEDSFWLSVEYKDPKLAQKAAAYLAEAFIRKSATAKQRAADATRDFIQEEAQRVKAQLAKIEKELALFYADHPEFKPDPTGTPTVNVGMAGTPNPAQAAAARRRRQRYADVADNPAVRRLLERKGNLEAQLQLARNPKSDTGLVQAKAELARAKASLLQLRQKYTERHPDVQDAERYVDQLKAQVAGATAAHGAESAKVKKLQDQLASLDAQIAKETRKARRKHKGGGAEPEEEDEAAMSPQALLENKHFELSGERKILQSKYEEIQRRLLKSELSGSLDNKAAETEYTIVDPASFPNKPSRPSRTKIVMAGSAVGLMLGMGLAALFALLDPRIYNEDDLRKAADLPVLAQIPEETA